MFQARYSRGPARSAVGGTGRRRSVMGLSAAVALAASLAACSAAGSQQVGSAEAAPSGGIGDQVGSATSPSPGPASSKPLDGRVIVLDPGHNGDNWAHPEIINKLVNVITEWKPCDTTGTQTDAGYTEHAFTFNVARRLAPLLKAEGATVILTRSSDHGVGPCITRRAAIANRAHADVAISVHADGGPSSGSGFEVIEPGLVAGHNNRIIRPSRRLGLDVRNAYHRITREPYANYIGVQGLDVRTDLGGLNLSKVPKVFIECGNMRNGWDATRLSSSAFRERIARALAAGLTAFLVQHATG
jgi:N-acetylmuramoyl-L-alanine amidase